MNFSLLEKFVKQLVTLVLCMHYKEETIYIFNSVRLLMLLLEEVEFFKMILHLRVYLLQGRLHMPLWMFQHYCLFVPEKSVLAVEQTAVLGESLQHIQIHECACEPRFLFLIFMGLCTHFQASDCWRGARLSRNTWRETFRVHIIACRHYSFHISISRSSLSWHSGRDPEQIVRLWPLQKDL